jgi:hypothetical protein
MSAKRNNDLKRVLLSDGATIGLETVFVEAIKVIAPQGVKVNEYCNNVIQRAEVGCVASTASIVRQAVVTELLKRATN